MNIQEIISKKRDKQQLSKEEIEYFVTNYTNGGIPDYQAAALTMAIYINGMNEEETTNLTLAMAQSGEILDLSELGTVVDKHSTGGIGDKVTLILAPIIASLGIPVAKMSGRGLGYTGGTIDKLEAIPGYKTDISICDFKENVKKIGISLMGQTLNLAPADKKLYALRDTISATESIPLISSSIMSKKIAAGANKIVLDVTCGDGAFMKNIADAVKLAETMKAIGKLAQKETVCVITAMDEPLGEAVGNSLEVIEAINALKGDWKEDVKEVVLELGAYMIKLAGMGEKELKRKQINYLKLTGQTKVSERIDLVDRFNEDNDIKVFLISLKAGGTGLNLTGADMVIHYDPWWNISAENQATDRTYRIGQRNNVQVYKLITKNSIEEKIYDLQKKKEKLVDNMLSTKNTFINQLSKEDIMNLFG